MILLANLKISPDLAFSSQKKSVGKMHVRKIGFQLRGKRFIFEYVRNKGVAVHSQGPVYHVEVSLIFSEKWRGCWFNLLFPLQNRGHWSYLSPFLEMKIKEKEKSCFTRLEINMGWFCLFLLWCCKCKVICQIFIWPWKTCSHLFCRQNCVNCDLTFERHHAILG